MDVQVSLTKLSDAIGIPLTLVEGKISGGVGAVYEPITGLKIKMPLKASKAFTADSVGVIFHVLGNLSVMLAHYPKTGVVSAYIIDESKLEMEGMKTPVSLMVGSSFDLRMAVKSLREAIKASFVWRDQKWSSFNLPA